MELELGKVERARGPPNQKHTNQKNTQKTQLSRGNIFLKIKINIIFFFPFASDSEVAQSSTITDPVFI